LLLAQEWNALTSHSGCACVLLKARKVMTGVSGRDAWGQKSRNFGGELSLLIGFRQIMRRDDGVLEPGFFLPRRRRQSHPGDSKGQAFGAVHKSARLVPMPPFG